MSDGLQIAVRARTDLDSERDTEGEREREREVKTIERGSAVFRIAAC